ncbi:CopG family transcriptional regulator [Sphingopyxis flava]|uniref:CopG family transcriptional regulator n=1 Tax=Sphingopyxis flava TaxID=1507287 RepID=A0A1T5GJ90_9SPHN|nr:CopG family transcriptional regulator [Sphingopyxis flava]SKC08461.1 hypothetical protein SAMN06295937_10803 [Sphingopyxis flava]
MYSTKQIAVAKAQAKELREQARSGGMRFEAYLPSKLADWVLDMMERGVFISPSEAIVVILGEHMELEPHQDIRKELMRRRVQAAFEDPSPPSTPDEVRERIKKNAVMRKPPVSWSDEFLKRVG